MNPPYISLDIESTGLNPVTDRIVQFAAVVYGDLPSEETRQNTVNFLINPGFPMSQEVIDVHGITDAMVAKAPPFALLAKKIHALIHGKTIIGFNLFGLDLPILWEELNRCGIQWNWRAHDLIDVGSLFKIREQRTLTAAVKFYLDREHGDAHSALADATATAEVLSAQVARYADLQTLSIPGLAAATRHPETKDMVDLAGKFGRNAAGQIVYAFGKSKGVPVVEDRGFARWMLDRDFPTETKQVAVAILEGTMT